jgi:protocadherin delta 1
VNDQPPTFTPSSYYTTRVSEAAKPGSEVIRVVAVDFDKNPGAINYTMVYDTDISLSFEITDQNRQTGIVTLSKRLDREVASWINITVIAMDNGKPPLQSHASVHVEIEDVNDNSPEWQVP